MNARRIMLALAVVAATEGCNQGGLPLPGDGGVDARPADASPSFTPGSGQFAGGATGQWVGLLIQSFADSTDGTWTVSAVTSSTGGFVGGNVLAVNGLYLQLRGAPRTGVFDSASADLLDALMLMSLQDGTALTALKRSIGDGGTQTAGSMSLALTSVSDTQLSGSLDATLVNNDPTQSSPTATFHASF